MKKIIIILVSVFFFSEITFSQGEFDAIKFSQSEILGTARFVAMSGAFSSLGGDMSSFSQNPAGIAVYRSSEFSYTPYYNHYNTGSYSDNKWRTGNIGYVGSFNVGRNSSGLSNFNFGFNYNKIRTFERGISVSKARDRSFMSRIADLQGTYSSDDNPGLNDLGYMAHETKLLIMDGNNYVPVISEGLESYSSNLKFKEKGDIDEWNFSFGCNWNYKIYFGLDVGITSIDYTQNSTYTETSSGTENVKPISYDLYNHLSTDGTGVNLKLGFIYRPVDNLRFAFAYHSPTYYTMTDTYYSGIDSYDILDEETGNLDHSIKSEAAETDYEYETPSKFIYGMSYIFGNKGLISADLDIIDYTQLKLKDDDGFEYEDVSNYIDNDMRVVANFRLGAEYRVSSSLSLRGGYAYCPSPYKKSISNDNVEIETSETMPQYSVYKGTTYLSCGFGYRIGDFFIDAAYQYSLAKEDVLSFYDKTGYFPSKVKTTKNNIMVTFGLKL